MTGTKSQAGGKVFNPAAALACLFGVVASPVRALAASDLAPSDYVGSWDPATIREILMGGLVVVFFLAAIIIWVMSALRNVQRNQRRNAAFVSSALNSISQGIVMVDPRDRLAFCNDSYLEMYGLDPNRVRSGTPLAEIVDLRFEAGSFPAMKSRNDCPLASM